MADRRIGVGIVGYGHIGSQVSVLAEALAKFAEERRKNSPAEKLAWENGPGTGQITLSFYPPAEAPHGPFAFTWRTYVHRGDAIDGKVAAQAQAALA